MLCRFVCLHDIAIGLDLRISTSTKGLCNKGLCIFLFVLCDLGMFWWSLGSTMWGPESRQIGPAGCVELVHVAVDAWRV